MNVTEVLFFFLVLMKAHNVWNMMRESDKTRVTGTRQQGSSGCYYSGKTLLHAAKSGLAFRMLDLTLCKRFRLLLCRVTCLTKSF